MATAPDFVRFVKQTGFHSDCGVACTAMLAGVLYEDALVAAASVNPTVLQTGLTWPQMRRVAKLLGLKTLVRRRYDVTEDTGILNVRKPKTEPDNDHVVFLWEGRVIEAGGGELWREPDMYFKQYGYTAGALLIAVE